MKELKRTRRLTIAAIVFVTIISVGLFTLNRPAFEYQITPEEMVGLVQNDDYSISPEEARTIFEKKSPEFVFVDLRSQNVFDRGTLPGAINIPVSDILNPENIRLYMELAEESVDVILFAKDQRAANGPWMLLRQVGIENVLVLVGGYEYMHSFLTKNTDNKHFLPEEPALDFAEFMEELGLVPTFGEDNTPMQIQTVPRQKKSVVEGGC